MSCDELAWQSMVTRVIGNPRMAPANLNRWFRWKN